jgi:hypothetical protein
MESATKLEVVNLESDRSGKYVPPVYEVPTDNEGYICSFGVEEKQAIQEVCG